MRTHFDAQLATLNNELITMGSMCEAAINNAVTALKEHDREKAHQIYASDSIVDKKEREIEALCLSLILHQQPIATDLRNISAALKMITDMERIADQAADIAEITLTLDFEHANDFTIIDAMCNATTAMVKQAIDAYVNHDLKAAEAVYNRDDEIDMFFVEVKNKLAERIRNHEEASQTAMDLLMIAKYLERIGDHACNIAGWVKFAITGQHGSKNFDLSSEHTV